MKLFILIILLFVVLDVLIIAYVLYRRTRRKLPAFVLNKVRDEWKDIIRQKDHRHAIMDADKLLDYALGQMGLKGSLGSKLKAAPHLFKNINHVWLAHKVRNNIAHQINFHVDTKTYKQTMLYFKEAFKDLNIF